MKNLFKVFALLSLLSILIVIPVQADVSTPIPPFTQEVYDNSIETFPPLAYASGNWNGAPSIIYQNGYFYVSHRVRAGVQTDPNCIRILQVHRSTDLTNWELVWEVSFRDISGYPLDSLERSCLRYYDNQYIFWFCGDGDGADKWHTWYVTSPTVAGLQAKVLDATQWIEVLPTNPGWVKDPIIRCFDNTYYLLVKTDKNLFNYTLYQSDNPYGDWQPILNFEDMWFAENGAHSITGGQSSDIWQDGSRFVVLHRIYVGGLTKFWITESYDMVSWTTASITSGYQRGRYHTYEEVTGTLAFEKDNGQASDCTSLYIYPILPSEPTLYDQIATIIRDGTAQGLTPEEMATQIMGLLGY